MTVASELTRNDYVGNASQTVFTYAFRILDATDLDVFLNNVFQTSGYTVQSAGDPNGGTVTFTAAPGSSVKVAFVRDIPATQLVDYVTADRFPAETTEFELDKITLIIQQLYEAFSRAILTPIGNPPPGGSTGGGIGGNLTGIALPSPQALFLLRWNALATALENVDPATLFAAAAITATLVGLKLGDGSAILNGETFIGRASDQSFVKAKLTAGTGIQITNAAGSISIASLCVSADTDPILLAETGDPAAPAANKILLYAKDVAGVTRLFTKDAASLVTKLFASTFDFPSPVALKILQWNAGATALQNATLPGPAALTVNQTSLAEVTTSSTTQVDLKTLSFGGGGIQETRGLVFRFAFKKLAATSAYGFVLGMKINGTFLGDINATRDSAGADTSGYVAGVIEVELWRRTAGYARAGFFRATNSLGSFVSGGFTADIPDDITSVTFTGKLTTTPSGLPANPCGVVDLVCYEMLAE